MKTLICIAALFTMGVGPLKSQTSNRLKQFNLSGSHLAIEGYDPISYFTVRKAIEGSKLFKADQRGVTYYFSSKENRDLFNANPGKYEPQYGGWCAYAMGAKGEKVEIDPETFKIVDGKLYLFYNRFFNNTKKTWDKDEANLKQRANANWQKIGQ